jgi:hypothetical protein
VRRARYRGLLTLAGLLPVFAITPARSDDAASDKLRICIARALPETVVTIGFTPFITVNIPRYNTDKRWFDDVKSLFWRVRFPADATTQQAVDRPEVTIQLYGMVLYPQMVWGHPVNAELRSLQGRSLHNEPLPKGDCLRYAELSPQEISDGQLFIQIHAPTFGPAWQPRPPGGCEAATPVERMTRTPELDFDRFIACRYEMNSLGMAHNVRVRYFGPDETYPPLSCPVQSEQVNCTMVLSRDGWSFSASFSKRKIGEWRAIADALTTFMEKATVSRDDITVARIDRRPLEP